VALSGSLPLADTADSQATGAIDVTAHANLATLAEYAPPDAGLAAQGTLDLSGTVRGTFARVEPDLTLQIANGSVTTPDIAPGLSNVSARARVADGAASVEQLTANFGTAVLELTGTLPLALLPNLPVQVPQASGDAQVLVHVRDFDPGTAPGVPDGLSGRISLDADLSAPRPEVQAVTGTISFPELSVAYRERDLTQQGTSTVRLAEGTARISQLSLAGSAGTLRAQGTVGLSEKAPLDATVTGTLNVGAVASLSDRLRADGEAMLDVAARGTLTTPDLRGSIAMADVTVAMDEPAVAIENLAARVDLAGDRVTLSTLEGELNGGRISGSGGLAVGSSGIRDVNLRVTADDVAMSAPLDLRSLSAADLQVTERDGRIVLGGKVTVKEAGLTGDLDIDSGVIASLTGPRTLDLTEERNETLERVEFNVQVVTDTPVLVDNNLARAEVALDLRLLGSPYETGLSGRMSILEGGEIDLNERKYQVQRGEIRFLNERRITPSVDLNLTTSASSYDITLAITGEPGKTDTMLTSDPALPENDILALLVTGRTLDEMRGEEGEVAKEQVLSYLGGRVGSRLGRGLQRATGLSEVRIEPNLIANETDPSARLTIGQDLTDKLKLIYSADLADNGDRVLAARYDVTRRFRTNLVNQSDGSYRFDFQHDVRKGGRPAPAKLAPSRPTIASIDVPAADGVTDAELRDRLGLEAGKPFDYFAARKGVDRVEKTLRDAGRLQSRVRLERKESGDSVVLTLRVQPGPVVHVSYVGVTPPSKVRDEVASKWARGVFDTQRGGDAAGAIREWLMGDQFLAAKVDYRIEDAGPETRRVIFSVVPGPKFEHMEAVFAGASGISPDVLDDIVHEQDLELELFTDPSVVSTLLQRYYREEGYLAAEVDAPRPEYAGTVARAVIDVREGPKFTVGTVSLAGNTVIDSPSLLAELPVVEGEAFVPAAAANAQERIRELYWRRAYNDVNSDYELRANRDTGVVDVAFTITEGARSVVADVGIEGNDRTSPRLVREQVALEPGAPLDLSILGNSRRQLYDTGAFSIVDITRMPLTGPAIASTPAPVRGDKPVQLDVAVREVQPVQIRYGASYDTERGPGGIFEISNHNSLGKARELGLRTRYAARLREARLHLGQPSLRYAPTQTTASIYYREERNTESALVDAFNVDRYGVSIQRERKLRNSYLWSYGYRYERARQFGALADPSLNETIAVAPLTSTFSREARDEILDASTGSFTAHAFSYSPGWLGADQPYIKYHGQFFRYFPLEPPRRKRFTNEVLRPRLVYAVGARVGLARGLGGDVPETERFYAGGSTTLRGFAQNAVGPIGPERIPIGGDMMLVINNEIRVPLVSIIDGVGFVDIGNVFRRVADFSFTDLRRSAGVGLRLRTPWLLIRGDYGVVLDPRPGEGRSQVFFSVGQAF
jgi:outer membrane protein insertion porin family